MLPCESGDANRVEHHGGIGEIRDVSERIGKTVPGKLPVVLNKVGGRFLLRGMSLLMCLSRKERHMDLQQLSEKRRGRSMASPICVNGEFTFREFANRIICGI